MKIWAGMPEIGTEKIIRDRDRRPLIEIVRAAHSLGTRISLVSGCFDLLTLQKVAHLHEARAIDDKAILVAALNSDASAGRKGPGRPFQRLAERAYVIAPHVDYVTYYDEDDASEVILDLCPDYFIKSDIPGHRLANLPEAPAMAKVGCTLKLVPYHRGGSTHRVVEDICSRTLEAA